MDNKGAETMLSIEEIKKACEFAEGFEINPKGIYSEDGFSRSYNCFINTKITYPLFLQRVIEGINSHFAHNVKGWFISQSPSIIKAYGYGVVNVKDWVPIARFTFDNAKEEAIRYILAKL